MCGRFGLTTDGERLQLQFGFEWSHTGITWRPRYNIAPTQDVLAVVQKGEDRFGGLLRWGLVPYWAKGLSVGSKNINARAETVGEKPSFREALLKRRCLVIANGFYEWRKEPEGGKTPLWIHLASGEPFAFAGLWETWKSPAGERVGSCTILTTDSNELIAPIHNRMPVILNRVGEERWLDPGNRDLVPLFEVLVPHPADGMAAYPVSPLVNSVANDVPECIERAA